jgi:hypothetical protein
VFARCDECGSGQLTLVTAADGSVLQECGLCGALSGSAEQVEDLRLRREAQALGVDPRLHGLATWIAAQPGLELLTSRGADPELGAFPFVQFAAHERPGRTSIENLLASLALARAQLRLPWLIEAELAGRLIYTLKPRIAPASPAQSAAAVRQAYEDLGVIHRSLLRDQGLSWWRRGR